VPPYTVAPAVKEHKKREYVLAFAECGNRSQASSSVVCPRGIGPGSGVPRLVTRENGLTMARKPALRLSVS
jgi:hypothetical protein